MNSAILRRIEQQIERDTGVRNLVDLLAERLSPSDLTSVLIEVSRRHSATTEPAALLARYATDPFVRPSDLGSRSLSAFDAFAFSRLPDGFEAIELSPTAALGTCSALSSVAQSRILSAHRGLEVVSDSTNVLALECALRRRHRLAEGDRHAQVRVAASHRLVRVPRVRGPHASQHFRALALCTAGRDSGAFGFELAALTQHIGFYLQLFAALSALDYARMDPIEIDLSDLADGRFLSALEEHVVAPIQSRHPAVVFHLSSTRTRGRGYYRLANFQIRVRTPDGDPIELCDGGPVDWTAQLLSNKKERLVISGLGTERLVAVFGNAER